MALIKHKMDKNPCLDANVTLGIDEACFSIVNEYERNVTFYSRASECYLCEAIPRANLEAFSNNTFVVTTKYPLHIYYKADYEYCHESFTFKEHGSYGWNLSEAELCSHIYTLKEPEDSYIPIYGVIMTCLLLLFVWQTSKMIIKVVRGRLSNDDIRGDLDELHESETAPLPILTTTRSSTRIKSVDTFRGIAILLMIFVNNHGGEYVFFNHSPWYGLTVADLVLPWFAWIMGLTITISKRAELRVTTSRIRIICRCLKRTLVLMVLGLMLNSKHNNSLDSIRYPGVLQLLGVTYFMCAALETVFMKAHSQFGRFPMLRDVMDSWPQWWFITCIVTAHTLLSFLLPVPNCPKGYFGPGGYDYHEDYKNCTAGAAGYVDRLLYGNHTYANTKNAIYGTVARFDPEGLMNSYSAVLVVYLGVQAGKILLFYYQCNSRIIRWFLWATVTGLSAGILCNFGKEGGVIPVVKKLWTLSYVLTTSSFAFLLFAMLYLLIDYKQYWNGAPFVYAGTNPLVLYVGHILTMNLYPFSWEVTDPTHTHMFLMNLWTTFLWALIAYVLYIKDIIITV